MTKSLRHHHRQIWLILAVLLPIGIVLTWLVIPNQMPVKLLQHQKDVLLPVIVNTRDMTRYRVTLRSTIAQSKWQLEWENKQVLDIPSAVIYKRTPDSPDKFDPAKAAIIGRIEARGNYVFPIPGKPDINLPMNLVLFDFIHEQIIDTINL